ncbi:MAG: NADH-quinone oxidoreductase subunit H [Candidatus Riesia sp.]|nr:NADH-quinone oxidoreductase subunit H [Candidatus Riesia sp.]
MLFTYLVLKITILCLIAIGIRGTLPRYRIDQITQYNWKHFVFC